MICKHFLPFCGLPFIVLAFTFRSLFHKQRHYFANKGSSSQAMVFPVVMYGCENWTVKKAER